MASNKKEALVKFRADTADFTKGIQSINKSMSNFQSDLKVLNSDIKANGGNFDNLTQKGNKLKEAMSENSEKIKLLQKKLDACKNSLGENSDEYNKLYKQLNNAKAAQNKFEGELKQTEKALENLNDETQNFEGSLKKLNKGMDIGSVGTIGLGTALGNLASNAISACIESIKQFTGYLLDLPESTREFRNNLAKLSASTEQYGYNTEQTNKQMKELYGYFADEQVAVNAITNLQGMKLSQEDLTNTTNACIAVWTAYGDSIPIEGLTESVNETAQVAKVTGSLADALNWAGISEDEFNKKLEKCKTTQERAKLITDTLNKAYGESKTSFDKATEGARNAEEAPYDLQQQQAETAKSIEPLTTELDKLKTKLLNEVSPAIEDTSLKLTDVIKDTSNWCDELNEFNETGLGKLSLDLAKLPLKLLEFLSGVELNRKAQEKWNKELQAEKKCLDDVKNALHWVGDVYDAIKNKGMSWSEALQYANKKWGENTKRELSEVEKVQNEKFDMMKKNADKSSKESEKSVKTSLDNTEKNLTSFNPNWKVSKPNITDAENQRQQLLNNTTQSLTNYNPSWKISKPQVTDASNTGWLNNYTKTLQGYKPSWSIPKPSLPKFNASLQWTTKTVLGKDFTYPSGIKWNAKGGIFTKPTIFATPNAGLQGVGEAGAEAIIPLDNFYKHLDDKLDSTNSSIIINMKDFHIHDNMDINDLTEQIAFNLQRKLKF